MNQPTFHPFQVRPNPQDDLDECHRCGAPHGELVMRKRGDWLRWEACSSLEDRKAGYNPPTQTNVRPNGLCGACWAIQGGI